ncbi:MAG: hypothetical protein DI626_04445 [Micavibrio aeruginosavorus]|uniref:VIT family protein n=1 Tax=Micavibrio aeruginosavorus TaxID=349221 RepID=A0A2W5BZT9_9BACT|nr:MAG: hypothetical protein DI626_04445 [Micavibrio aeruginosavorus]
MKSRIIYNHHEKHFTKRTGWLRAAVLGANDGIISISSLMVGVASASDQKATLLAGIAGLIAGAISMAAGEYVSVSSQSDLEQADLARERRELNEQPEEELQEMIDIYTERGVEPSLAKQICIQMMEKDALGVHAREELGITDMTAARPLQAATASALSFAMGGAVPLLSIFVISPSIFVVGTSTLCILLLGILGAFAARAGGAPVLKPAVRVMFWGAVGMGLSSLIGGFLQAGAM